MTGSDDAQNGAGAELPPLSEEELKRRAEIGQRLAGAFGQLVSVMMRSDRHRHAFLAELEWMALPALATGQFSIADAQHNRNRSF